MKPKRYYEWSRYACAALSVGAFVTAGDRSAETTAIVLIVLAVGGLLLGALADIRAAPDAPRATITSAPTMADLMAEAAARVADAVGRRP